MGSFLMFAVIKVSNAATLGNGIRATPKITSLEVERLTVECRSQHSHMQLLREIKYLSMSRAWLLAAHSILSST